MSSLNSLTITGYKSIRDLRKFKLNNLNVLIGANGAGKSNFIGLFRLLNEMYQQNLQVYVQTQGGPDALLHFGRKKTKHIHAEFYFSSNGYEFDLIPTSDNRLIFSNEYSHYLGCTQYRPYPGNPRLIGTGHSESKLKNAQDTFSPYVRQSITEWRVYHFHDTSETAELKRPQPVNDNIILKNNASNIAPYLRMLRKRYEKQYHRIVETVRLVAPFFGDFIYRPEDQEYVELEWTQREKPDTPFNAHILSDGTLRFICLATLLLQPVELIPDTILIDEPELGLHPYAISVLADIFKQVSKKRQLIVSTQSVELVNELSPQDVIVVDYEDDASIFRRFSQDELSGWLEEYSMGEL